MLEWGCGAIQPAVLTDLEVTEQKVLEQERFLRS